MQGLLNFYPTTPGSGSTVMCLGSHHDFEANCQGKPRKGSFVRLVSTRDNEYCRAKAVMVMLGAGDLLLWDSRTVHCSSGVDPTSTAKEAMPEIVTSVDGGGCGEGGGQRQQQGQRQRGPSSPLTRLVAYISMLPRESLGRNEAERAKVGASRRQAVLHGLGSGHDPRKVRSRGHPQGKPASNYAAPAPDDPLWALV